MNVFKDHFQMFLHKKPQRFNTISIKWILFRIFVSATLGRREFKIVMLSCSPQKYRLKLHLISNNLGWTHTSTSRYTLWTSGTSFGEDSIELPSTSTHVLWQIFMFSVMVGLWCHAQIWAAVITYGVKSSNYKDLPQNQKVIRSRDFMGVNLK